MQSNNYKLEYESKRVSAETAAQVVRNGYRVHFGTGAGIVDTMDKALAMRVSELRDVTILSTVGIHEEPLATYRAAAALGEEGPKHVRFTSAHFSAFDRRMADEGNCWYMPMMFCELPELWNDNGNHIDVAMFQVGPILTSDRRSRICWASFAARARSSWRSMKTCRLLTAIATRSILKT